jgi:hypothetical protein
MIGKTLVMARYKRKHRQPIVYFLLKNDKVVYIGLSHVFMKRIYDHIRERRGLWDKVAFFIADKYREEEFAPAPYCGAGVLAVVMMPNA